MVAVIMGYSSKKRFPQLPSFPSCWRFQVSPCSIREMETNPVDFGNHLCSAVLTLLCYIYSRREPFDTEKPADHQAYILRHFVRTIGLYRPFQFLYGATNNTVSLALARRTALAILPTAVSLICTALASIT
jgi:hypothetical protein